MASQEAKHVFLWKKTLESTKRELGSHNKIIEITLKILSNWIVQFSFTRLEINLKALKNLIDKKKDAKRYPNCYTTIIGP